MNKSKKEKIAIAYKKEKIEAVYGATIFSVIFGILIGTLSAVVKIHRGFPILESLFNEIGKAILICIIVMAIFVIVLISLERLTQK